MFRQLLLSLVVIGAAAVAYVFFVPGASETLARFGITLPFGQPAEAAAGPAGTSGQQAAAPGQRGPGGGGQGGQHGGDQLVGNRTMVVVTAPVLLATINDKLTSIGEGAAAHSVTVVSPASGTLAELLVRPGESVAAGAVIGRLDADAERIAQERAKLAFDDA